MNYRKLSLQIIQYNVQKRLDAVQIPFLNDPIVQKFDIIAIQEPGRNRSACGTYNPSNLKFHLVNHPGQLFRTCFYIDKDIDPTTWSIEQTEDDFCSIRIITQSNAGETQTTRIHNINNPSPISTTSTDSPTTLYTLAETLTKYTEDTHIVVGDLNLHHPYWGGSNCLTRHAMSDQLIAITTQAKLDLYTPPGMIPEK